MNLNKILKELDKLHRDNKIINFRIRSTMGAKITIPAMVADKIDIN